MVRFEIADCDPGACVALREQLGVSNALAQILVRRGYDEPDSARAFLAADRYHGPDEMDGLPEAARLLLERVRAGARITIHGDYDVDGVCSTAILVRALRRLQAHVDWYLPDRAEDGYGLSAHTVRMLARRGTELLVTVDCGITAVEEVELARSLGIETIVTDHHSPRSDGLLPAAPIVHPALGGYPCPQLCAAAVSYKLAQALFAAAGIDAGAVEEDLDLVALATVADVVALVGENRSLVRQGLRALSSTAKPGLRALMKVARVDPSKIDERALAFGLAPRINAAGRLYRADAALELVLTEDALRAAQVADELDRANSERRQTEQAILAQAEAQIASQGDPGSRSAIVLGGEGWHPGVIGIVASRLVERHRRPVVLVSLSEDTGRGSARSIEGYDLLAGLTACAEHLTRYGGHRAAAGVELSRDALERFAGAMDAHAAAVLSPEALIPRERVDALVSGPELGMDLAEELKRLAPFGMGNPSVSLMVENAVLSDLRTMGEGKHARFTVRSEGAHARAVAFGSGMQIGVREGEPAQATFALEVNEWNGVSEPRLVLRRAQPLAVEQPEPLVSNGEPEPIVRDDDHKPLLRDDKPEPLARNNKPEPLVRDGELVLF